MLNITITEQTPHNMLRAICAACNELLGDMPAERQILNKVVLNLKNDEKAAQHVTKANRLNAAANSELDHAAASLSAHNAQGGPVDAGQFYRVGEQPSEQTISPELQALFAQQEAIQAEDAARFDSSGAEWNPELHASTKTKNTDGTWKKRRGAGGAVTGTPVPEKEGTEVLTETTDLQLNGLVALNAAPSLPPLPPAPPAPATPTAEEDMRKVYALITSGICTLNDAIDGAKSRGFVDLGAFSRDATPEQRAQLLAQLTKEVA